LVLLLGFNEIIDEPGDSVEAHSAPLSTGRQSQSGGNMTLSQARIAHQDRLYRGGRERPRQLTPGYEA
jgi:hypothetical protein